MNAKEFKSDRIADDLLRGAEEIANEVGYSASKVYHAHRTGTLPIFTVGNILHARKSRLREYFATLEQRSIERFGLVAQSRIESNCMPVAPPGRGNFRRREKRL